MLNVWYKEMVEEIFTWRSITCMLSSTELPIQIWYMYIVPAGWCGHHWEGGKKKK